MGMVIIFFLFLYVIAAIGVIALVRYFITTNRWISTILILIAILLPTYDIIITNILGAYYCSQEPNPKTLIKKKVEYPLSIYWEDNVYPGFSAEDRKLMIINYLDGIHLKTMALNGDDGKIYVYHYENVSPEYYQQVKEYSSFSKAFREFEKNYEEALHEKASNWKEMRTRFLAMSEEDESMKNKVLKFIPTFTLKEEIYTKETMSKMNYTVTFDEVPLNSFTRKFLFSDETKIIDNSTKETIAYNRRIMRFSYNLHPDFVGGNYYYPHPVCGENSLYYDGDGFKYIGNYGSTKHENGLNKYIKGEK
jgi:hypothetical protein